MECSAIPKNGNRNEGQEPKLIAAKIGEEKINEQCWEGTEWDGKKAECDSSSVAFRDDDGASLRSSWTGSGVLKHCSFLLALLSRLVYAHTGNYENIKVAIFKCMSCLNLGFLNVLQLKKKTLIALMIMLITTDRSGI